MRDARLGEMRGWGGQGAAGAACGRFTKRPYNNVHTGAPMWLVMDGRRSDNATGLGKHGRDGGLGAACAARADASRSVPTGSVPTGLVCLEGGRFAQG